MESRVTDLEALLAGLSKKYDGLFDEANKKMKTLNSVEQHNLLRDRMDHIEKLMKEVRQMLGRVDKE